MCRVRLLLPWCSNDGGVLVLGIAKLVVLFVLCSWANLISIGLIADPSGQYLLQVQL